MANTKQWVGWSAAMFISLGALPACAEVKVASIFGDHMVLQQGKEIPVWGTADANERVTVSLGDRQASATADANGKWLAKLPAQTAGGGALQLTVAGGNTVKFEDVLVGEVWIASGQSNMEMGVGSSMNIDQERAAANLPQVRMFTVKKAVADAPQTAVSGEWQPASAQTVGGFSGVGYFFARDLHKELKVPVGIIHTSWGGTPAESWTDQAALETDSDLSPIVENWKKQLAEYPQKRKEWEAASAKAKAEGKDAPWEPAAPENNAWKPAGLYNAMIAPLVPYATRGAIWYQGESNAGRAYQYRKLLPVMIQTWRKAWDQPDFAFLIVQLANFTDPKDQPGDSDWAELREAQAMTAAQPHNGLATAIDIGEAKDIHPKNKQEVGRRLALVALHDIYGKSDQVFSGPVYESMKADGNSIRLKFKHADGLMAKGGELKGFAIAGDDKKWHWAYAKVEGDQVVVNSDAVKEPKAVRYAWAHNPDTANLYNGAGLPAFPFRTDDWPGVTANNR